MQKIIIFMLLFTLSFSIAHDSFISVLEHEGHQNISQLNIDEGCESFNEMHNMFHFMAIVTTLKILSPDFAKYKILAIAIKKNTSPLQEGAYKPPII